MSHLIWIVTLRVRPTISNIMLRQMRPAAALDSSMARCCIGVSLQEKAWSGIAQPLSWKSQAACSIGRVGSLLAAALLHAPLTVLLRSSAWFHSSPKNRNFQGPEKLKQVGWPSERFTVSSSCVQSITVSGEALSNACCRGHTLSRSGDDLRC